MSDYRRISIILGAFLILALMLTACGSQPTPAPVKPATQAPTAAPTKAPPTEAPKEEKPTEAPTAAPTEAPTAEPTEAPAAEDLLDEVKAAGKLVVSTDPNYAPQSFLNDAGELDGFDVDVAKEVAKRLGVEVEFVTPEWDMITSGNWSGRWDISIGSMTPTEPRSEVLWFTDPYYYVPASFAVHKDNTDIKTPDDLTGKRVGLGTSTTYEDYLKGELAIMGGGEIMYDPPSGVEIAPYPTDGDAIQDLALGDGVRLDAVMSAQPTIQTAIDSGVPLKYVGTPAFYEPLVFALDKSRGPSDKMLAKLNEIIAEMHKDGTLTKLSEKWYGIDYTTVVAPGEENSQSSGEKDLLDEVKAAGKLVVSTDPNYAPQSFLNDAGELDGFDVDVAKEVAKRLGVEVEFVTPEWDMITSGNWSGRWDISIGSMTPTEPRSEVLWFTDPYYYVPASFAVHKDNTDIKTPDDLTGKRVGLGTSTTYEDYLKGELAIMGGGEIMYDPPSGVEIAPYPTDGDAIQDLALGDGVRLDAVMSAQPTIQTAIDSGVPLKYVGTPAFYEPLVFALDKSRGPSDKMLAKLNEIIAEMHKDGTLTKLSEKWYGIDYTTVVAPSK